MIKLPVEPLSFEPIYFEKIWGGSTLKDKYNRQITSGKLIGESWELSGFQSSQSIVNSGDLQGVSLGELVKGAPRELTGSSSHVQFPLLIKFIDASNRLSVQVHPGIRSKDAKSECWYVADAKDGASLITGFSRDVTRDTIIAALESKSLHSILNEVPIKTGEMYYIPSGTVHAIMGNCLIYEVQQSSDTTFRLYDWDRSDASNKSRELHIEQALDALEMQGELSYKIDPVTIECNDYVYSLRIACKQFALEEYLFLKPSDIILQQRNSFRIVTVVEGFISVRYGGNEKIIEQGKTILLPAVLKEVTVRANSNSKILLTFIPDLIQDIIEPLTKNKIEQATIISLAGQSKNNQLCAILGGKAI
ncbi:MAG: class I mannose-6-phosphate isomerase [Chitinispirillaceae bacterium]|nr:class I mannose-6-phosphate isomerase [Chitinispirillaceae bacterium]